MLQFYGTRVGNIMTGIFDLLLDVIHLSVITINCFFWIVPGTPRKIFNLVFSLTVISWLILGYWYGLGYCFLTDIHWEIKRSLGENLPPSYIHYILENWFNIQWDRKTVDWIVASIFVTLFVIYVHNIVKFLKSTRN